MASFCADEYLPSAYKLPETIVPRTFSFLVIVLQSSLSAIIPCRGSWINWLNRFLSLDLLYNATGVYPLIESRGLLPVLINTSNVFPDQESPKSTLMKSPPTLFEESQRLSIIMNPRGTKCANKTFLVPFLILDHAPGCPLEYKT